MTDLFLKLKIHQEQNLPFVLYCKPNSHEIIGLFQTNDHLYFVEDFKEKGFVFAPFDGDDIVLLPEEFLEVLTQTVTVSTSAAYSTALFEFDEEAKKKFENLVKQALDKINSGYFKKVVLSRKEKINLEDSDVEKLFSRLIASYPLAFKYCFYHPKIGMWMGATPEQLMKVKDFEIHTVALAGTKVNKGNESVNWKQKEKDEQQLVTDFILENLKEHVSEEVVSSPYTATAGNLLHIKTDISAKLNESSSLKDVLKILHPTPAVCGYPKWIAKDFILENEGYNREYYAGFLGEFNRNFAAGSNDSTDLFVNLRCMKIKDKTAHLYVGCGITKDSDPEKEFLETANKSHTMKKILY